MIDYHVHTPLCNHANGVMEDYVRRAVAVGLREICFLDHLTLHERGRHLSMTPDMVPLYYQAVRDLGHRYRDRIAVKAGLEVDFDPRHVRGVEEIVAPFDFDVLAGSVHFIDDINMVSAKDTQMRESREMDDLCGLYLDRLLQMVETMDIDIICHLDIYKKFGRRPGNGFQRQIDAVLAAVRDRGRTVELNTSGLYHPAGEFYPGPDLIAKIHECHIPMTLGSDAHKPEQVGRNLAEALDLLTAAGFRSVAAFTRRGRRDLSIPAAKTEASDMQPDIPPDIFHGGAP